MRNKAGRFIAGCALWVVGSVGLGGGCSEPEQQALNVQQAPPAPPGPMVPPTAPQQQPGQVAQQQVPASNLPAVPTTPIEPAVDQDTKPVDNKKPKKKPVKDPDKDPVKDPVVKPQLLKSKTSYKGCVADKAGKDSMANRSEKKKKSELKKAININKKDKEIVVRHDLDHPCCLKAKVSTAQRGSTITVKESFTGNPCHCLCNSTLKTKIAVPPGKYEVELELEMSGHSRKVSQKTISM